MPRQLQKPTAGRIVLGFVLAPLAATTLCALIKGGFVFVWLAAGVSAYLSAIVFGIPAYLVLSNWLRPRIVTLALIGGCVAIIPMLLLIRLVPPQDASVGNCVATINYKTTWCGFLLNLEMLAEIFAYGAFGGIVFWVCVVWRGFEVAAESSPT